MPSMHRGARRPGSASAVRRPPTGVDERVAVAVDHERRARRRAPSAVGAARRRDDGQELAADARRVDAAVVGLRWPARRARASSKWSGLPIAAVDLDAARRWPPRGRRAGRQQERERPRGSGWPTSRSPVVDMIDVSERTRVGVLDGHRLGDHPAHRRADDVGRRRCRGRRAARARRRPCRTGGTAPRRARPGHGLQDRGEAVAAGVDVLELGRQADVAVVEADDEEAAVDEGVARAPRPRRSSGRRGP